MPYDKINLPISLSFVPHIQRIEIWHKYSAKFQPGICSSDFISIVLTGTLPNSIHMSLIFHFFLNFLEISKCISNYGLKRQNDMKLVHSV